MTAVTEFTIGTEVSCTDGPCGELRRVVLDPVARALTHLVVEPKHGRGVGHLVPIGLVVATANQVDLACTTSEFEALPEAEETQFIPGGTSGWGYGQDQMLSWPYYRLGVGVGVPGTGLGGDDLGANAPLAVSHDIVPMGDVEVRRGDHVFATDGAIGRVQGLVVDPTDHRVTHVLLDEGHLWGQKRVAVPIGAVTDVEDGVRLKLSKDEVRDLPEVGLLDATAPAGDQK
jgi:sporulation protein YlmC with PRC-barrel domain